MTDKQTRNRPRALGKRGRLVEFSKNLALSGATLLVCFLVLEIVFRILAPAEPPGTTYGKPIIENADGFRDREFAVPKPEGTYRILVLGDSFTWGIGLDVDETILKLLEQQLAAEETFRAVEVINAADPGANTVQQRLLLREKGLKYEPDQVLVIYNLNDIEYLPQLSNQTYEDLESIPVVEIDPGEDIRGYSRNQGLRGIILEVERHSVLVRFLVPRVGALLRKFGLIDSVEFSWVEKIYQGFTDENPGWLESKRSLMEIADECRAHGCTLGVAIYPLFANLERYEGRHVHRTILDFCKEADIRAIDLLPLFEGTDTQSHWINFMDSHPNAAVHRSVATALLPVVREQMRAR